MNTIAIVDNADRQYRYATRVLEGNAEYDGADAARIIKSLCEDMNRLSNGLANFRTAKILLGESASLLNEVRTGEDFEATCWAKAGECNTFLATQLE